MATMESEPAGAAAAAPAGSEAVDAALTKIAEENVQMEVVQGAVVLLGKVLANIVATPEEAKFRALKKANKQVAGKILPCRGALALCRTKNRLKVQYLSLTQYHPIIVQHKQERPFCTRTGSATQTGHPDRASLPTGE